MTDAVDSIEAEAPSSAKLPPHVPSDLVRPFPYILGATTTLQPHSFIAEIHEGPAIFWAENAFNGMQGAWIPRRTEDLHKIYFDHEHFTMRGFAPFASMIGDSWYLVPAEVDPPHHGLLRAAVNPLFTPKRMSRLEEQIRIYAREAILAFRDRGACELMADFAFEFPIRVFLELMGLPQAEVGQFLAWEHKLMHEPDFGEVVKATRAVVDYLRSQIDDRRANPRDDFITFGVQAEANGVRLDDDQLMGFCFNLFIGGLDTVSTNIGLQFRHLAEHPDHQRALRENPAIIPDAIDEMMRAYAAVATSRECIKQVEINGVTMMPGDKVAMATYLAGRDPEVFASPEKVILDRKPRHISFGYGPHLCIGMHLARREMRIALEEFLSIIPEFGIAPGAEITSYLAAMISPVALPLTWAVR